jgi:hypothetical protein
MILTGMPLWMKFIRTGKRTSEGHLAMSFLPIKDYNMPSPQDPTGSICDSLDCLLVVFDDSGDNEDGPGQPSLFPPTWPGRPPLTGEAVPPDQS